MIKRKVLQYEGGGYDGYFWEWNFCFWDNDGRWHDIFSSGRKGLNTEEKALAFLKEQDSYTGEFLYRRSKYFWVDLDDAESVEKFSKEAADEHVCFVSNFVNTLLDEEALYFICHDCEKRFYPSGHDKYPAYYFDPDCYRSDGGIGIIREEPLCEECFLNREHQKEEEQEEEDDISDDGSLHIDGSPVIDKGDTDPYDPFDY